MVDPITAKYYKDVHILSRLKDINLATAVSQGVDPTTYLNLNVKNYLTLVFEATLLRMRLSEVLGILDKVIVKLSEEVYQPNPSSEAGKLTLTLRKAVNIKELARKYGLEIKNNKCVCPFHEDKDPSLVFYPKTNSFFCFGCRVGGDVVEFYRRMEELNG